MKNKFVIGNRRNIAEIYEDCKAKKNNEMPKYGDFLVRYISTVQDDKLLIIEIFNEMADESIVSCLIWWNFRDERGNLNIPHGRRAYYMGGGFDTYKANNYEIELLVNKLKEAGYKWDFNTKQLIRIE